ncbi:M61 family metallopeptidase [Novosphingobium sp. KACC 22771]|uniref:M61 family metallopeptidase n=1 Tax=Novosphingobium sp. KACC 22771 TaxID=3025670 RepID=UPI00236516B9|nr:peptidase M61 [Novosphingobium sp. KACC 22771]WDF72353.1 peptidase M61 [Novosphingobium sp. KACC 22771]
MTKPMHARARIALGLSAALLFSSPALAQRSAPAAIPVVQGVPDARDVPYPGGTITLDIDATDIARGLFRVSQTVPVAAGAKELILQLPQWVPGGHNPRGTIDQLADVKFYADGKLLTWHRDPTEVFAFHIDLPAGAKAVVAKFVHTSPLQSSEGRITMTPEMLNLQWDRMSLYPAGYYTRQIKYKPSVTFPEGWQVATALDGKQASGNKVTWDVIDYEALVDSPIFAGAYFKRFDLGRNVFMNVVADKPELLEIKPEHLATYRALVEEAWANFGSFHFDHYDFLLALTDRMGGIGLEHHRSSENAMAPKAWVDWKDMDWARNVISHEFTHSWDGKFRRPDKLWTPDYRQPMQGNLLWVYEGQTQFWGYVLAARSGIQTKEAILGAFAANAGMFTQWAGRDWRSVEDTGFDPVISGRRAKPYASINRNEDYYTEGALMWLEADQIIREGTKGKKGLDDFARAFFGIKNGDWGEVVYNFKDVASALNGVYAYDWEAFLDKHMNQPGQPAPLAGIEKAGYKLVWKDTPNPYDKGRFASAKALSLAHSLGIVLNREGVITSTLWNSPAFEAALVTGTKIVAVNGATYSEDAIKAAITAAKGNDKPITLVTQRGEKVATVVLNYHDGLRYPWLERAVEGKEPAGLDLLLAPKRLTGK